MSEKYVLIEDIGCNINSIILQTFASSARIKLTCFDISSQYIVFGTNTGAIYFFKKHPCEFLKYIPKKNEGTPVQILISPSEENIAIANSNGLITIIQDCFSNVNMDSNQQVFSEYEGSVVTNMKWNLIDLYIGDIKGKVCIVTLSNLLPKTIFQSPINIIMELNTSIVQLDVYHEHLLVSTLSKTYLCNTKKEYFKQIGKKPRDGIYGACFFIKHLNTLEEIENEARPVEEMATVFCARPGLRLWESNFVGSVIFTQEYRNVFSDFIPPDILQIDENIDGNLTVKTCSIEENIQDKFNFRKLFLLNNFIFTHDNNMVFILDPLSSEILFCIDCHKNIRDFRVVKNLIYIWCENGSIVTYYLQKLEDVILSHLFKKHYYLTGELCIKFSKEVINLLEHSKRIHLVRILETKLSDINEMELLKNLNGLLLEINTRISQKNKDIKLQDLKVFLNGNNSMLDDKKISSSITQVADSFEITRNIHKDDSLESDNFILKIFSKEFLMNKKHDNLLTPQYSNIVNQLDSNKMCLLMKKLINSSDICSDQDIKHWSYKRFLQYFSNLSSEATIELSQDVKEFLILSFCNVNTSIECLTCFCGYPLPKTKLTVPRFYKIGCFLLEQNLIGFENLVSKIPYMFKYHLENISDVKSLKENLSLLVQFGDLELLKSFCFITVDLCDEILVLMIKISNNVCLNCDQIMNNTEKIDWDRLGFLLVDLIGSDNVIRLIKRYNIPNCGLTEKFYKTCIFSSLIENKLGTEFRRTSLSFCEKVLENEDCLFEFDKMIAQYLLAKYMREGEKVLLTKEKCKLCELPLNIPVINGHSELNCGHKFHPICQKFTKNVCDCYNKNY